MKRSLAEDDDSVSEHKHQRTYVSDPLNALPVLDLIRAHLDLASLNRTRLVDSRWSRRPEFAREGNSPLYKCLFLDYCRSGHTDELDRLVVQHGSLLIDRKSVISAALGCSTALVLEHMRQKGWINKDDAMGDYFCEAVSLGNLQAATLIKSLGGADTHNVAPPTCHVLNWLLQNLSVEDLSREIGMWWCNAAANRSEEERDRMLSVLKRYRSIGKPPSCWWAASDNESFIDEWLPKERIEHWAYPSCWTTERAAIALVGSIKQRDPWIIHALGNGWLSFLDENLSDKQLCFLAVCMRSWVCNDKVVKYLVKRFGPDLFMPPYTSSREGLSSDLPQMDEVKLRWADRPLHCLPEDASWFMRHHTDAFVAHLRRWGSEIDPETLRYCATKLTDGSPPDLVSLLTNGLGIDVPTKELPEVLQAQIHLRQAKARYLKRDAPQ